MRPRISIVMPAYNAERTIANAINSVLNQTISDWELVVVNDGSADLTRLAIQKFKDERIKYVEQEHAGLVVARNRGNYEAQGDILATADADDLSLPDRLEKSLEAIKFHDVVLHGGYINMWDAQFQCIGRKYVPPGDPHDVDALLKAQTLPGWPVFRKDLWERLPFRMETQHAYDWMMHLDWVLSGARYKTIDVGLYEYVRFEHSASQVFEKSGLRKKSQEEIRRIVKEIYQKDICSPELV